MSKFLQHLATAHRDHEGWFPGSVSWRNNNPGNLRLTTYHKQRFGAWKGAGGFAFFPSYEAGFDALMDDLEAKITGRSVHIDYSKNPTLLDYVSVYAPVGDGNNPMSYAGALIHHPLLKPYQLLLHSPLRELATFISDVPIYRPTPPRSPSAAVRRIERLIAEAKTPARRARLEERLRTLPPIS